MATLFSSRAGVLVASVPYIVAVLIQGEPMSGIIEPVTIIPEVASLVGYVGAFSVGWALRRRSDALARISRGWGAHLIVGAISLAIMLITQGQVPLPVGAALVAIGIGLADLSLSIVVKLLIILITSSAILLLTYQLVVRRTPIGTWLNGREHPWRRAGRGA